MFIKEAEKNKEQYKKPTEAIVSPVSNNRQKEIKYNDVDGNLKYMTGDIIDLRDEISPDNHIKRILRIALTSADHTNIEVPVKSLVTTPDPKFAVIRRLSEFVYEITEYVR